MDLDESLNSINDEIAILERESRKQTAISYCIAFENFLRDFLIEKIKSNLLTLEDYFLHIFQIKIKISEQPNDSELFEFINTQCKNFQNFDDVSKAFKMLKEKSFFNKEDIDLKNITLLFEIRHQIIHRKDKLGSNYAKKINQFKECLHSGLFNSKPSGIAPSPEEIFKSTATSKDLSGLNKLDEFAEFLKKYATRIVEFYNSP